MRGKKLLSVLLSTFMFTSIFTTTRTPADAITRENSTDILKNMTLEEKVGQVLMPSFPWWNGAPLTEMNDDIKNIINKYHLGGMIFFRSNCTSTEQFVKFTDSLHNASPKIPLILSTDQEGDFASTLTCATHMTSNMALGAVNDKNLTYKVAKATGEEINALGVNITLGPVLDTFINPGDPVIGVRSFGDNPNLVAEHGKMYVNAIQSSNVSATVKHFPGNSDSTIDSHDDLEIINHDLKTIDDVDLKPFKSAINNGVDMIMTGHFAYPALDNSKIFSKKANKEVFRSATVSKKILQNTLRGKLGFNGVIMSDALDMGAITNYFEPVEAAVESLNAGCDILLMPIQITEMKEIKKLDDFYNGLLDNVKTGKLSESRLNDAVKRILDVKIKRGIIGDKSKSLDKKLQYAKTVVSSKQHKDLADLVSKKSITLIKNEENMLPIKLENNKKVVIYDYNEDWTINNFNIDVRSSLDNVKEAVENIKKELNLNNLEIKTVSMKIKKDNDKVSFDDNINYYKSEMDDADYVIIAPYFYYYYKSLWQNPSISKTVEDLVDYANLKNKKYVYLNNKEPYDAAYITNAKSIIATYGNVGIPFRFIGPAERSDNITMGVRAAFGLINPTGKLPVDIKKINDPTIFYKRGHGLSYNK